MMTKLARPAKGMRCCALAILLLLGASTAWAGFYVIPSGPRAKSTIVVSPGATPEASGQALLQAMASIDDNSQTKPYLIKIEPGIYDIGNATLQMKEYVDVEGSGQNITIIKGNVDSSENGVVNGADWSCLRHVTVFNIGSDVNVYAIAIMNLYPFEMENVTVKAMNSYIVIGISNIYNNAWENPVHIKGCRIEVYSSEGQKCVAIDNYCNVTNYPATHVLVEDTYIYSFGTEYVQSVYGVTGVLRIDLNVINCDIYVLGGDSNYGIYVYNPDEAVNINNTRVVVDNPGRYHYGVHVSLLEGASINSSVVYSVGDGIYCFGQANLDIVHSIVEGGYKAIETNHDSVLKLGSVQLKGGILRGGSPLATFNCHGCFDGDMSGVTCP